MRRVASLVLLCVPLAACAMPSDADDVATRGASLGASPAPQARPHRHAVPLAAAFSVERTAEASFVLSPPEPPSPPHPPPPPPPPPPRREGDIVFSAAVGDGYDLYAIEPDGSALRRLTDTPNVWERAPVWSNDRTRIAHFRDPATLQSYKDPDRALGVLSVDGALVASLRPTTQHVVPASQVPVTAYFHRGASRRRALWAEDDSTLTIEVRTDDDSPLWFALSFPLDGSPEHVAMWRLPWLSHDTPVMARDATRGALGICSLLRYDHPDGISDTSCFFCERTTPTGYNQMCPGEELADLLPEACDLRPSPCVRLELADLDIRPVSPADEVWAYTIMDADVWNPETDYAPIGVVATWPGTIRGEWVARGARMPRWSPDGTRLAYIRADGIYVKVLGEKTETRIYEGKVDSLDW